MEKQQRFPGLSEAGNRVSSKLSDAVREFVAEPGVNAIEVLCALGGCLTFVLENMETADAEANLATFISTILMARADARK